MVLSGENRLTAIDVASGRRATRRVRSLPACGAELFVTGGHIVFSAVIEGSTTVFSIPLALDRRPTRLGTAHLFVRSSTPPRGAPWLGRAAGSTLARRSRPTAHGWPSRTLARRRWSVALVDARTGTPTPVRGSGARNWYPDLRWSSSGWLFIRAGFRVQAYRPGAARVERLPVRLPRSTIAFAAG